MHILQVDCEVHYLGRGETLLPRGVRLLLIKADGSVSIHRDKGMRPLNYMPKTSDMFDVVGDDGVRHMIFSHKDESLDVTVHGVLFETHLDGFGDEDLERYGTEDQLQEWLSADDHLSRVMGDDTEFVCREYETGKGPVDVLGMRDGRATLVEVKRFARRSDTFQLLRYREALVERCADAREFGDSTLPTLVPRSEVTLTVDSASEPVLVLVAERFASKTRDECERLGIEWRQVKRSVWRTSDDA